MKNELRNVRKDYDMVVFCHLRWQFVFQRPQHLITRFAKGRRVLFVEEPIGHEPQEHGTAHLIHVNENLTVLQPRVNSIAEIVQVLPKYAYESHFRVGWFYSASFVGMLDSFTFDKIVYDCMDELALFKGASAELITQEEKLLERADVVFTGGKSLFESKTQKHGNVHCFPSSVERLHFEKALNGIAIPDDIAKIPHPIVGYYGVIDERIDYALLQQTAVLNPEVSFVMIGPLAKVSEDDLPRASNIYYLGMKSYEQLPAYLKAFDVAMMPFALNDSTRFISPTKTLEYMAAHKPIISTPVRDVARDYNHCVSIVSDAADFTEALKNILPSVKNGKQTNPHFEKILNATSWDNTAHAMELLIENC
jgi:glycosyltransferase involved in cell wall biosynthesis